MNIKPYYKTPTDVAFYFRDKESVTELITFIYNEAFEQVKDARAKGYDIFCPITQESTSFSHQIDYQFLVHCVAKFIAKKLNDNGKYKSILNHFELKGAGSMNVLMSNNRIFLMMLFSINGLIYVPKKFLYNRNYNTYFTPKLVEYNNEVFEFKTVTFNQYTIKEYVPKINDLIDKNAEYFFDENIKQIAFGFKNVEKYYEKNNSKKRFYFFLDTKNVDKFLELYDMSGNFTNILPLFSLFTFHFLSV